MKVAGTRTFLEPPAGGAECVEPEDSDAVTLEALPEALALLDAEDTTVELEPPPPPDCAALELLLCPDPPHPATHATTETNPSKVT